MGAITLPVALPLSLAHNKRQRAAHWRMLRRSARSTRLATKSSRIRRCNINA